MALTTDNFVPTGFSTDAEFRAWGVKMAALLVAAGWVITADTGQINWATVLKPAAFATYQGYEIYHLTDAASATTPIYLKVEYGSGQNNATIPSIRISLGPSTNGAGTLTGGWTFAATVLAQNAVGAAATVKQGRACARTGIASVVVGFDNTTNNLLFGFVVERWPDAAGAVTTEGFTVSHITGNASGPTLSVGERMIYPAANIVRASRASFSILIPAYSGSQNGDIGTYVQLPNNGPNRYPSLGILGHVFGDIGPGSTFIVSRYGTPRTYYAVTGLAHATACFGNVSGGISLLSD